MVLLLGPRLGLVMDLSLCGCGGTLVVLGFPLGLESHLLLGWEEIGVGAAGQCIGMLMIRTSNTALLPG